MSTESSESNPIQSGTPDTSSNVDAPFEQDPEANVTDSQAGALETDVLEPDAESVDSEVDSEEPEKITDPKLMDRYECRVCGYTYEPVKGDGSTRVAAGTSFEDIDSEWKCVICNAPKRRFFSVGPTGNPSGFEENLGYGFGVNTMTPGQKNILIFGSLFLGFLFFLSLYGLN
ncbi:MAG: rubredoxin [Cyanobacteria bacterium P01_F01_bin.150]